MLKNKTREVTLILVNVMVLVLFFSGCSIGKQYSCVTVETIAKIAEPILVVEKSAVIKIDGRREREHCNFKVKNNRENGEITQVDLQYSIEIISQIEEAISFKLYKNNHEIPLENNKTTYMKLEKEKFQEDSYQLEIIYDKNKNFSKNDIIQDVQIKIYSEQIKV